MCRGKEINDIANEVDLKDHFKSKCLYEGVHMTFLPHTFSVQVVLSHRGSVGYEFTIK